MAKQRMKLSQVITPGDIILILIILAGIAAALTMEEISIKLIGISLSILSAVGLFLLISQRMTDIVEPSKFERKNSNADYNFTITEKKDSRATRRTVEDFNSELSSEKESVTVGSPNFEKSADGLRMKTENTDTKQANAENDGSDEAADAKTDNSTNPDYDYSDSFSGMRIKGRFKPVYNEKESKPKSTVTVRPAGEQFIPDRETAKPVREVNQTEQTEPVKDITPQTTVDNTKESKTFEPDEIYEKMINNDQYLEMDTSGTEYIETQKEALKKKYVEKKIDIPPGLLSEPDFLIGKEPRKEFEFFLSRILMIVRSITNTRTAVFLLANYKAGELILESFVTSMPDSIKRQARYPLDNDIISQILYKAKPEILSEINPDAELDLIPYYKEPVGTVSFIGVPIFYDDNVIGILCADSPHPDAYDSQTVAFLGHFTRLISMFVHNYSSKYELLQTARTLDVINYFNKNSLLRFGPQNIADNIRDTILGMFENAKVGICGFNGQTGVWEIKSAGNYSAEITGKPIDVEKSLLAECIRESKTIYFTADEIKNSSRVFTKEKRFEEGFFLAVPIQSTSAVYGAFFVELPPDAGISDFDLSILEIIGEHAGNAVEKLHLTEQFELSLLTDPQTGLYNNKAFFTRLEDEVSRSKEFSIPLSLCVIEIDKYAAISPEQYPDRYENAEWLVISQIKKNLKPYEVLGKLSNGSLAIIFFGKDTNQTKFWAERTRNEIANTMLELDGHKLSVTISVGAALMDIGDTTEELFEHAGIALDKSLLRRNVVHLYN